MTLNYVKICRNSLTNTVKQQPLHVCKWLMNCMCTYDLYQRMLRRVCLTLMHLRAMNQPEVDKRPVISQRDTYRRTYQNRLPATFGYFYLSKHEHDRQNKNKNTIIGMVYYQAIKNNITFPIRYINMLKNIARITYYAVNRKTKRLNL